MVPFYSWIKVNGWMDTDALQRSTHMYPNKKQSARKGSICCQNEFVQIFFD